MSRRFLVATGVSALLALGLAGCGSTDDPPNGNTRPTNAPVGSPTTELGEPAEVDPPQPADDPTNSCQLMTEADVREVIDPTLSINGDGFIEQEDTTTNTSMGICGYSSDTHAMNVYITHMTTSGNIDDVWNREMFYAENSDSGPVELSGLGEKAVVHQSAETTVTTIVIKAGEVVFSITLFAMQGTDLDESTLELTELARRVLNRMQRL